MNTDQDLKVKLLRENWDREMQAAQLYKRAAEEEQDHRKRDILNQLAQIEFDHAKLWEKEIGKIGAADEHKLIPKTDLENLDQHQLVDLLIEIEKNNADWYQFQRKLVDDPEWVNILDRIDKDELQHEATVEQLVVQPASKTTNPVQDRLTKLWGKERWHKRSTGDWVGDSIYGVNDGLGAIFGIIAGVAGYTNSSHFILVSGLFGALASTLSMGAGAYLSTKSENELMESEIEHERREIMEDPEHEIVELSLLYQLKGFTEAESIQMASRIASDKEQFVKTMAQEELGFHEAAKGNPWKSGLYGSVSTLVGGIVPLIPFFFLTGISAIVAAAIISLLAHFAVGAAKSLITTRSWWSSGLEMTAAGVIVGVVAYGLGLLGSLLVAPFTG